MSTRIHWLRPIDKRITACGRNAFQSDIFEGSAAEYSAAEFVAKHAKCPNVFCAKCARIAEEQSRVTFAPNEVAHLRALAEYVSRGFVGVEAREGLRILKGKVS